MKEFIIWGKAPGAIHEVPLYTLAKSEEQAAQVIKVLKDKHGCKDMRLQILDLCDSKAGSDIWKSGAIISH